MRFMALGVLTAALPSLLLACSSDTQQSSSGQTGSVGPSEDECRVASDCAPRIQDELARFTTPTTNPRHFDGAECTQIGIVGGPTGPSCVCRLAGSDGSINVGPAGLDCYVTGRGGDCLFAGNEFNGCSSSDATSCDTTCTDLEQRLDADAARTFEASSVYASCDEQACKTVIELDGRCFAEQSYLAGRSYDCSLGGAAILVAERDAQQPPPQDERPEDRSLYVEGTNGFVSLTVAKGYTGAVASPVSFGAFAQFVNPGSGNVSYGQIIDPLEGVDDCGVFNGSGSGVGSALSFYDAADVQLLDGATARPLVESEASNADFYSYVLELDPEDVEPRYGGRYGVHVSGGAFGATFDSADGLRLPEALDIVELSATDHVEQQALDLTWTGRGAEPLFLFLIVNKSLDGFYESTELRCLMKDDGAFTVPASVLQAMPTGFASATFERSEKHVVKSGSHSLVLHGSTQVSHRFVLGPSCDNAAALEACHANASTIIAAYEACGLTPRSLGELCPSFLANSCDACPGYFECAARETRCTDEGFFTPFGCTC
jgi:hypothetical protein